MAIAQNDDHSARLLLDQAIERDSLNAFYYHTRAMVTAGLMNHNRSLDQIDNSAYVAALSDFDQALSLEPENADFFLMRGQLFYSFHENGRALNDFEAAHRFAGGIDQKIKALCFLAKTQFQLEQIPASFRYLETALQLDSSNVFTLNHLANQYLELRMYDRAQFYFSEVLKLAPNDLVALSNFGYSALLGEQYQKALQVYDLAIDLFPQAGVLYCNRGFIQYKFSEYDQAMSDLNQAIRLFPANAYAYKNRALVFLALEQNAAACTDLLTARDLGYTRDYDQEVEQLLEKHCVHSSIQD